MNNLLDRITVNAQTETRFLGELQNWGVLQEKINTYTEAEVLTALAVEKHTKNRLHMLTRLYSRFSRLRGERERREVMFGGST